MGLVDTLKGQGPVTVFAPTDAALAKIPKAIRRPRPAADRMNDRARSCA
jgi:hypothetical protein